MPTLIGVDRSGLLANRALADGSDRGGLLVTEALEQEQRDLALRLERGRAVRAGAREVGEHAGEVVEGAPRGAGRQAMLEGRRARRVVAAHADAHDADARGIDVAHGGRAWSPRLNYVRKVLTPRT
jgi:hypothetical protein